MITLLCVWANIFNTSACAAMSGANNMCLTGMAIFPNDSYQNLPIPAPIKPFKTNHFPRLYHILNNFCNRRISSRNDKTSKTNDWNWKKKQRLFLAQFNLLFQQAIISTFAFSLTTSIFFSVHFFLGKSSTFS